MQGIKDKKVIIAVITALVLVAVAGVALAMNLGQGKIDIAEQLSLGEKYLQEMKYEKAILAFNEVIKVDPRNVEAYLGLADAYVGKGEVDKAIKSLEKGFNLTNDGAIKEKLAALKIIAQANPMLEKLHKAFYVDDIDTAISLMQEEKYILLSKTATHDNPHYFGGKNKDGTRYGIGLGCYPGNFYYYGEWENGVRSGKGLWIRAENDDEPQLQRYRYEGEWKNDLPNGEGVTIRNPIFKNEITNHEEGKMVEFDEIRGTFSNGLEHGEIYKTVKTRDGRVFVYSPIKAVKGVYQPNPELQAEYPDIENPIATTTVEGHRGIWCMDNLEQKHYVWGFRSIENE